MMVPKRKGRFPPPRLPTPKALMMASIAAFNQRPAARRVASGWVGFPAHWMRFHHQVICWIMGLQKLPNLGPFLIAVEKRQEHV